MVLLLPGWLTVKMKADVGKFAIDLSILQPIIAYNATTTKEPVICNFYKNDHFISAAISMVY